MDRQFEQSIRPILDCYDKIRIHLSDMGIKFPCICSVGCQSAGKSSVLESITGIQLPRGTGTVTRCPIMIQLRNAKKVESARIKYESEGNESWQNIKIEEIAKSISEYQKQLIEKEGNPVLSEEAIQMEVNRFNAPDLTLYDLPGITHKDEETFEKITNIITKYLENKETIALLVHSSTVDFDSNECLSLIRKISNDGKNDIFVRTIPIFSKPDDALKTNPSTLVNNLKIGKSLGFSYDPILVLNRSQDQIDKNVENEKIRKLEEEMLKSPFIKDYCHSGHGINALIDLLLRIQKDKLLESLPQIKMAVKKKLKEYEKELDYFPKGCKNRKEFNKYFSIYCDNFDNLFQNELYNIKHFLKKKGENEDLNENEKRKENCLETRIRNNFKEFKIKFKSQLYKYLSDDFYHKVGLILKDSIRLKPKNFYGEDCWDNILHEEIKYVFEDCENLIDNISKEIEEEVSGPFEKAFGINKGLYKKTKEILNDLIEENKNKCINYFRNIKTIECDRNFTINERYMDYVNKIQNKINEIKNKDENNNNINDSQQNENKSENLDLDDSFFYSYTDLDNKLFSEFIEKLKNKEQYEQKNIEIMCSIYSYLKIFLDRFLDYLYNGILFYLLKSFLQNNLTKHLKNEFSDMEDKTLSSVMGGDMETIKKMEKIEKKIEELNKAYKELINL